MFINPNLDGAYLPNFGLAYVLSSVEKEHRVKLLDLAVHAKHYHQYVLANVKEFEPDIIGFSVTSFTFSYALKLAYLIRKVSQYTPFIYGGVQPTLLPEETIQHPLVDAICIGEGEDSFREYLYNLENNREPKNVSGIWYKDKSGTIVRNPLRPFREDLDVIPFPNWDYWDIDNYLKLNESYIGGLRIFASRGCPYSCTFCSNPAIQKAVPGKFYRVRRPEKVIEEIKINVDKYYNKGFRQVVFADETFGLDLNHMKTLCSLYIKEGLSNRLTWTCQTRVEIITEEWAQVASGAGCVHVSLGVESGDEHIRRVTYNKDIAHPQIMNAVKILRNNNILCGLNLMVGCPEDSMESINESFKLIREVNTILVYFSFYNPLPETALYKSMNLAVDYANDGAWRIWNVPKLHTKFLNRWEVKKLALRIYFFRLYNFFKQGVRLRKMRFLRDILRYCFRTNNSRAIPLTSPHVAIDIEAKTLYRYYLEDFWKGKAHHVHEARMNKP